MIIASPRVRFEISCITYWGLISSSSHTYPSGCLAFHSAIWASHCLRASWASDGVSFRISSRTASTRARSTRRQSPTMGTCTWMFFEIDDGSMSMWTISALGADEQLRRTLDLAGVAVVGRIVRSQLDLLGPDELPFFDEHVLREVHVDRPGPAGGRDVEGLADDGPEVLAVLHEEVVLGARARDADVVRLLERVVADQVRGDLPRERDDRDRVHVGVLQRGHEVRRRGPRGHQAGAHLARRPRVALRGVPRGGFLADEDVADPLEVVEGVVDRQHRAAGQPEEDVDPFAFQTLEHDPRSGHSHRRVLLP